MTKSRTLHPTAAAARIAPLLITLAGLAIAAGGQWLWRHRRQIGAALVATAAATYSASAWCRLQVEALAADSARRLPAQPVAAVAPITATLAAAWGLVNRLTMARAERARRARLADIASAWIAELGDLPMVFAMEPIEPGEELLSPIRYRSSNAASAIEPVRFQAVVRVDRRRLNA
jgi:hypothetical protein